SQAEPYISGEHRELETGPSRYTPATMTVESISGLLPTRRTAEADPPDGNSDWTVLHVPIAHDVGAFWAFCHGRIAGLRSGLSCAAGIQPGGRVAEATPGTTLEG